MSSDVESLNIAARLSEQARLRPSQPAVICGGRTITFSDLDGEAARLSAGLEAAGIGPGRRVALMVPPSVEFYALTFALFRAGAVPVFIDPGMGLKNIGACLAKAEPEAFIGSVKAHLGRVLGGWGRATIRSRVVVGGRWPGALPLDRLRRGSAEPKPAPPAAGLPPGQPLREPRPAPPAAGLPPERPLREPRPDETAAILFTSGSTGAPKGAVYTHAIFSAQVDLLARLFDVRPGEVSVPTFPLFGLFDVALGMTAVIPKMDATRPAEVDPREILGPIEKHGAAQLFGSPALLDAVGRYAEAAKRRLPTLKRVISAGAPVPAKVVERFASLLQAGVQIHTPYGATEALPVCAIASSEILAETAALSARGRGTCVGRPVPGVEVAIINVSDGPLPLWSEGLLASEGEIGEIVARGPVVTPRYYNLPEATALAKIGGAGGVFHRMGDLGYLDHQGRVWFCGRKSQRVTSQSGTLCTIPCEAVFNQDPRVRRTALVGVGPPRAQTPVLCVELGDSGADRESLKAELLALGAAHEHTRAIKTILFHPGFPVDIRHNAKIFREALAAWAAKRLR